MGMMKNYLLKLLEHCSVEQFGQDAIEWAIISGMVKLSYHLDQDVRAIMPRYDELIEAYRQRLETEKSRTPPAPMKRAGRRPQVKAHRREASPKGKKAA